MGGGSDFRSSKIVTGPRPLPSMYGRCLPGHLHLSPGPLGTSQFRHRVDTYEAAGGDPITMTVVVSGEGNLATQAAPTFPDVPGLAGVLIPRPEPTCASSTTRFGVPAPYEHILVQNSSGSFILPAIEFSFFDPKVRAIPYRRDRCHPCTHLRQRRSQSVTEPPPVQPKAKWYGPLTDIRHIRPAPESLSTPWRPHHVEPPVLVRLVAAGFRCGGGHLALKYRVRLPPALSGATQPATPIDAALTTMRSARASGADPFPAAGRALFDYLAARLGRPASSLTRQGDSGQLSPGEVSAQRWRPKSRRFSR